MKRKFPLLMAMLLLVSLMCAPMAYAVEAPSPGGEIEIDDPDTPLVDLPTTPVEVEATVGQDGGATVEVKTDDLLAAIETVNTEGTMRITVTATGTENTSKVTAVLPTEALKAVAQQTSAELQIESGAGQVTLPNAVVALVVEAAGGEDVSIVVAAQDTAQAQALLDGKVDVSASLIEAGAVVEVSITSGDTAVTSWEGGSAIVALPVSGNGSFQAGESYTVYQVDADGNVHSFVGRCVMVNGQLRVVLSVNSLGTFVVLPETAENVAMAADPTMVESPLASRAAAPEAAPGLFASVQNWCDAAVKGLLQLFGL